MTTTNSITASSCMRTLRLVPLALSAALLAACAGTPERPPELVRLESELARIEADPRIVQGAPEELRQARDAVYLLGSDAGRRMDDERFDHNVYLADRLIQIAEAEGLADAADDRSRELARERENLLLQARTLEADRARLAAEQARAAAESERRAAELAREEAFEARRQLEDMQRMLAELQAEQTDRGLVVTLGDVLFEVDRAELKPGAARNLDKLVRALRENPEPTVLIEGHTDSTGSREYNMDLSRRRAQSVYDYLVGHGVDASRLGVSGLGPDYPVATNDTAAGRQQNRRVEIIIEQAVDVASY